MSNVDQPSRPACVDDVLITDDLGRRPSRAPDYEAENRALTALAQEMAANPGGVLQKLAELVIELCHADSAGISVLEPGGEDGIFRWHAAAGAFAANLGGTMPRDASPCGTVIFRDCVLLFSEAERFFPALRGVEPRIYENLLAPWHVNGKAIGTVWAIAHSPERRFDAEDARLLQSLARFASAAYQMTSALDEAKAGRDELERRVAERTHALCAANESLRREAVERTRSQEALRESEARYRALFEAMDEGFLLADVIFDQDGRPADIFYLDANPAALRMVNADFKGRRLSEVLQGYEPYWYELPGRVARTGRGERLELYAEPLQQWFDLYVFKPQTEDAGSPRVAILFQDITARKRAGQALRRAEDRLKAALIAGRMATWDWDPLTDQVSASDTMGEVFGLLPGETFQSSAQGLRVVHPDDLERHRTMVEAAARSGGSWHSEFRIIRPRDGKVAWLEERANATRDPLTGKMGMAGLVWDITERKQAEEALRASEARLRTALEIETVGVIYFDIEGRLTDANDAFLAMSGYRRADLESGRLTWQGLTPPEWMEASERAIAELKATGRTTPYEKEYLRKNGSRWWALFAAKMLPDGTGFEFVVDITERKQAEEERELLLGELNHRVKNLLAVVQALATQSEGERSGAEYRKAFIGRLDALVRAHDLALGRRWRRIDLRTLAGRTLEPYVANHPERIEVAGELVELPPRYAQSLSLVLHELATNAVKHGALSGSRGRVRLTWRVARGEAGRRLDLEWEERDGPPVTPPRQRSFGTRLIERAFGYELGGEAVLAFRAEGLRLEASFPLP